MNELRVLLVEDSEQDAALILRELRKGGYAPVHKRVETRQEMSDALSGEVWDVVLCDHAMPEFNSKEALGLLRTIAPDLPFIIVSGNIGEDSAVSAMKAGANDYIMKNNLKRLVPAIQREVRDAEERLERKGTEEELQKKEEELRKKEEELRIARQVEKMKDEFVGMVSHELKNPLTIITGALRVASDGGVSEEEARELVQDAIVGAEHLSVIIDNLLELSRSQKKSLSLKLEPCDISRIAQTVLEKLQSISGVHQLVLGSSGKLPLIPADPVRIERILYNLVDNAIKYSPRGGEVKVSISPGEGELVVAVSDQGIGISSQGQKRLFRHFERLENYGDQKIDGIGLGLKVCQILVEAHSGHIWVESEPGKGSTFFFSLPMNLKGS